MSRTLAMLAALMLALGVAAGCGSSDSSSSGSGGGSVDLVAYSTPQDAYAQIIKDFNGTPDGKDVKVSTSFGASGDQSRAVASGQPAGVVAFSLAPDINNLVDAKLVDKDWAKGKDKGFVTNSVVSFAVRKGNPKNIKTWDDLTKPGVDIVAPNPATSGGAKWNVMAAYGQASNDGKDKQAGLDYLKKLYKNVTVQDKAAREALQTFSSGKGDVLLTYENEALTAQKKGVDLDYVVPDDTILIQNPAAVTTNAKDKKAAKAFLDYLHTEPAQKAFADNGYRPVDKSLVDKKKFPTPPGLFTIDDLGGWSKVNKEFFDEKNGEFFKIQKEAGSG